jgi:hypothetical protein
LQTLGHLNITPKSSSNHGTVKLMDRERLFLHERDLLARLEDASCQ